MSDWTTRLTGEENPLTFTSPETGTVFTPYWLGTSVSGEKKIGDFSYPGFDGSQTQDLGLRGRQFPKSVWFSGPNYDLEAANFVNILGTEKGPWAISDPVWGELSLQLVSFNAEIQIVENGNIAVVTMQWTESEPQQSNVSPVQSAENVTSQIDVINESSSEQFGKGILGGEKVTSSAQ
ncbi:MAG TPA: hypothetical protein DDX98_02555, partial [Bacteroidales bacterium]|nr:hypothetical protein [Bacteroidales bacterium]